MSLLEGFRKYLKTKGSTDAAIDALTRKPWREPYPLPVHNAILSIEEFLSFLGEYVALELLKLDEKLVEILVYGSTESSSSLVMLHNDIKVAEVSMKTWKLNPGKLEKAIKSLKNQAEQAIWRWRMTFIYDVVQGVDEVVEEWVDEKERELLKKNITRVYEEARNLIIESTYFYEKMAGDAEDACFRTLKAVSQS